MPIRRPQLKVRHFPPKWIVIHSTFEFYKSPESRIDNLKYQLYGIEKDVMERSDPDFNYHFIVEKIKDDYQVFVCRPFVTMCEFDDIDININKKSIHVALMGDYNLKIPEKRMYDVLAYRLIAPLLSLFSLNTSKIKTHDEISLNEKSRCPGEFFDKDILILFARKYTMR